MAPVYELVGSIASHMATRVENAFDSDATGYQPPVASLPVVRLLQPMTDSRNEADFDCQGMVCCILKRNDGLKNLTICISQKCLFFTCCGVQVFAL